MEFEEWLIWDGRAWKKDHKKLIERIANQYVSDVCTKKQMRGYDDNRRRDLTRWAQSSERSAVLLNSIDQGQRRFYQSCKADLNLDPFSI